MRCNCPAQYPDCHGTGRQTLVPVFRRRECRRRCSIAIPRPWSTAGRGGGCARCRPGAARNGPDPEGRSRSGPANSRCSGHIDTSISKRPSLGVPQIDRLRYHRRHIRNGTAMSENPQTNSAEMGLSPAKEALWGASVRANRLKTQGPAWQ